MTEKMQHINTINSILCMAEQAIQEQTGLPMRLIAVSDLKDRDNEKSPEGMLKIIADALEMNYSDYTEKVRIRKYVMLRQIACYLMKEYFEKKLTLKEIAAFFDQDHTSVIHSIDAVEKALFTKDDDYVIRYNVALEAVTQWMVN